MVPVGSRVSDTVRTGRGRGYLGYDSQPALYDESQGHQRQIAVFESSGLARTTFTNSHHTLGRLEICELIILGIIFGARGWDFRKSRTFQNKKTTKFEV